MEKVNLTKYGFIRTPDEDFSDDGTRFYCYAVGRVRVSKAAGCGMYFIDGRIDHGELTWEEYSNLPHYKAIGKLNGIRKDELTEDMLEQLYEDCLAYEQEYDEAERTCAWPTLEEIAAKRKQIREVRQAELDEIKQLTTVDKLLALGKWDLESFRDYYKSLAAQANPTGTDEEFAKSVYHKAYSKDFVKSNYELKPSWYYTELKETLAK